MDLGDIGLSPASRESTQTNKPLNTYIKTGAQDISYFKKKRKHTVLPYGSVPPQGFKSHERCLTSLDLKAKVIRLMASELKQIL